MRFLQHYRNQLVLGLFCLLMLTMVGPVMRESDQASLLDGAVQLSRDKDFVGRVFYNYDRQYGSYWVLSACFALMKLDEVESNPENIVYIGNLVSCVVFMGGLLSLALFAWRSTGWELLLTVVALSSPVFLFSIPVLSSNIVSGGCLCFLASLIRLEKKNKWVLLMISLFGFLSVSCRADAVLVMPWLVILGCGSENVREIVKESWIWFLATSSLIALLLGSFLSERSATSYAAFFDLKVATAFLIFGFGSLLLLYSALLFYLGRLFLREKSVFWFIAIGALLLPLCFYGRILFTPRHLTTTALLVLLSLFFNRSRSWWTFFDLPFLRVCGVMLFVLPMVIGIRLSSLKKGRLIVSQPTLYPSADGFWPMGCNGLFLYWLSISDKMPIDHNQQVWGAWSEVEQVPSSFDFCSNRLQSFGFLRATIAGSEAVVVRDITVSDSPHQVLADGRTIIKNEIKIGVDGVGEATAISWPESARQIGSNKWGKVFCLTKSEGDFDTRAWEVRLAVLEVSGGNDFFIGDSSSSWNELRGGGPFRWLLVCENDQIKNSEWELVGRKNRFLIYERLSSSCPEVVEGWLARSALPYFFDVSNYGRP